MAETTESMVETFESMVGQSESMAEISESMAGVQDPRRAGGDLCSESILAISDSVRAW